MQLNLRSISTKLILGGVSAVLIPLIIVGYISYSKARTALSELSEIQVEGISLDLARMTRNILEMEMGRAATMASQQLIMDLATTVNQSGVEAAKDQVDGVFRELKRQFSTMGENYQGIFITDVHGMIYTGVLEDGSAYKKIDLSKNPAFVKARDRGMPNISEMIISKASGMPATSAFAPIKSDQGAFLGVLGTVIKAHYFTNLISNRKVGKTGYGVMINNKGIVLAHPKPELILKFDALGNADMHGYIKKMVNGETGVESYVFKGTPKIAGFAPVGINGWSVSATQDKSEFLASSNTIRNANIVITLMAGVIIGIIVLFAARSIVRPINAAVDGLRDIAQGEGDLTMRLPATSRDEVGELARWFNTFIEKLQGIMKDIAGGIKTLSNASTELSAISEQMTQGTEIVTEKSNAVSAAAEEMSANMNNVAAAMEQSATNTNMVAAAAEEMSATIDEIARNAEKARGISDDAAHKATSASTNMDQLGVAANSIGKVIETITDISEQVNLLALNATIEAARAGEAGKGFAVVANEIKELAKQTATATQDIKDKIEGIQGTTTLTVGQISEITQVIKDVNDVVATIATAVEEQSAATKDIAGNVNQASQGIQEVNENVNQSSTVSGEISKEIAGVSVSMNEMSTSSNQINLSAQELSTLSDNLKTMVDQFKV
ncbi:Methyl-accepting chemotaxis sensory transducer with Cache sensor [Desulfosarcina cetonica]|uniref:methyl-accepting chemotaxis protein n=1 Tax=Desulfosarcina cetonica TaxID=90730 RepID=UPI0006D14026|nr:methyl-accepting chemotaxis protein [Desulfosarcina cetonica]VTR67495.1 Methyl-accepting chemotaxis sensory transducer with Cache sensor [Desulfosarcina cetonica]